VRLSIDIFGERISAVCEVYLDVWESRSSARRQELVGALRQALAAMRRCTMLFPSTVPLALLWHGRLAFSQGAGRLARSWRKRFAKKPPAVATSLPGELSRIFQLLARGLA
jgi:hypothetical protein